MAGRTAIGLLPEPGPDPNIITAELEPWDIDLAADHESAYLNMVRVIGLGVEHWIECPGCPGCDVLGALVNQVRLEASGEEERRRSWGYLHRN